MLSLTGVRKLRPGVLLARGIPRTESSASGLDHTKRCRGIALANYMRDGVRDGRHWDLGTVLAMPEGEGSPAAEAGEESM